MSRRQMRRHHMSGGSAHQVPTVTEAMEFEAMDTSAPPQIQMTQPTHPPLDQVNAAAVLQNSPVQVMPHEPVPNPGIVRSNSNTHHPSAHPMATKVNQEILTSLHFIKDIRRLEKYQRDFFLKVYKYQHSMSYFDTEKYIWHLRILRDRNASIFANI